MLRSNFMQLCDIYLGLGEDRFHQLVRSISMGRLKTYQLFDRAKARFHLAKLNSDILRKASPRIWVRVNEKDEEFASDLAQFILVGHLDMIKGVLDFLGIPNEGGFFAKDSDASSHLTDGWQQRAWEKFSDAYDKSALLFYINHLDWELKKDAAATFLPDQV